MVGNRYDISGLVEAQFEPGSRRRVLRNLLGVKRKRELDSIEAARLADVTDWAIRHFEVDHRFTAEDICLLHRRWLGDVYSWAGEYRQVNISKGNFHFAMAAQVPRLMQELQRNELTGSTPCAFDDPERVIEALAVTHAELVLIHPFREGNGRISRLLATLMALQAGMPLLDFSGIRGRQREAYFVAVQAAMSRNYEPMKAIFRAVLRKSGWTG